MIRVRHSLATSLAALALLAGAPASADAKTASATLVMTTQVVSLCAIDPNGESVIDARCANDSEPRVELAVERGHHVTVVHF